MNNVLTRRDAALKLLGSLGAEEPLDWFAYAVATHFDFDSDESVAAAAIEPPASDVEVLLAGLGVGSLEALRDLVEAGKRARERTPLVVV